MAVINKAQKQVLISVETEMVVKIVNLQKSEIRQNPRSTVQTVNIYYIY